MAEFTNQLPGVTNRIRVQDPGPRGPSFLAGLADAASTAISNTDEILRRRQANRVRRADEQAAAIEGEANQAFLVDRIANDPDTALAEIDDPAIRQRVERLRSSRLRAEQTGDWASFRTDTERFVMEVGRDSPEMLDEIYGLAEAQGASHYLFRAERERRERYEADREQTQEDRDELLSWARGYYPPDVIESLSDDELAYYAGAQRNGLSRLQAAADRVSAEETIAAADQGRINSQILTGVAELTAGQIGPALNNIYSRYRTGELSGEALASAYTMVRSQTERLRSETVVEASRAGADADTLGDIEALFDRQIAALDRYVDDDTYRQVGDALIDRYRLEIHEMFPALARLTAIGGEEAVMSISDLWTQEEAIQGGLARNISRAIVGGDDQPNPGYGRLGEDFETIIVDSAGGPVLSGGRPSVEAATLRMGETLDGLIGEASLETIERNGPAFISVMLNWARRAAETPGTSTNTFLRSLPTGRDTTEFGPTSERPDQEELQAYEYAAANGDALEGFASRYESLQDWAIENELVPGQWGADKFWEVRRALFNPLTISALRNAAEVDPELATRSIDTGRTMLDLVNGYRPATGAGTVMFNPASGRYEVDWAEWSGSEPGGWRGSWSNLAAREANRLLDQMVELSDIDPRLSTANMNDAQIRAYYATGVLPDEVREDMQGSDAQPDVEAPTDSAANYSAMMVGQEGGSHTTGYIPTGGSGVTIGIGLDLGQQSRTTLRVNYGFPPELIEKLEPYLGLQTRASVESQGLDPSSLTLTPEEEEIINNGVIEYTYNRARSTPAWENLDQLSREAIVSIRHWAGYLSADSQKLAPGGTNYLWPVLSREDATRADIVEALRRTLADMPDETEARYNRIERLINDLT